MVMEVGNEMQQWRIYMDCCCFSRPYDDLTDALVRLESEAVMTIIDYREQHDLVIYGSDVLEEEINRITDKAKLEKVLMLYSSSISSTIELCDSIITRASDLLPHGLRPFDALHLASAEYEKVDVFLSTDKRLLNAANRTELIVKAYNPAVWLLEVLLNEQ